MTAPIDPMAEAVREDGYYSPDTVAGVVARVRRHAKAHPIVARLGVEDIRARTYDAIGGPETGENGTPDALYVATLVYLCDAVDALARPSDTRTWQPIATAPTSGPIRHVLVLLAGGHACFAHYAHSDGEGHQPAFRGWFKRSGNGFCEVKPTHWLDVDEPAALNAGAGQ
jgi:hypothetical protein